MFGLRECDRFGAPPKRLLGGVEGFYEALGGLLARYFVRAGGLGRPFLFKWGAAAQKIVGCVLSPVWVNSVSSTDSLRQYYEDSARARGTRARPRAGRELALSGMCSSWDS